MRNLLILAILLAGASFGFEAKTAEKHITELNRELSYEETIINEEKELNNEENAYEKELKAQIEEEERLKREDRREEKRLEREAKKEENAYEKEVEREERRAEKRNSREEKQWETDAGYTKNNESRERVKGDKEWNRAQDGFDRN